MMQASLGGVVKTILWIFIISGIIRFVVRLTANYAVNKVNEEVRKSQRAQSTSQQTKSKQSSGHKTPDSEYVDFIEIKDQE